MTNLGFTSERDADTAARRPVRRRSTRRRWLTAVLLLVALTVAGAVWLGTGLLGAARDLESSATGAQSALQRFGSALQAGDPEQAREHLASARAHLADADAAAGRAPVRVAAALPVLGGAVDDVDHLLRASHYGVDAGEVATDLYDEFAASAGSPFAEDTIDLPADLPALREAAAEVERIDVLLAAAEAELVAVQADLPGMAPLADARDRALARVRELRAQIDEFRPALDALPVAFTEDAKSPTDELHRASASSAAPVIPRADWARAGAA